MPDSPYFNPIEYVNNELKRQIKIEDINNKKELIEFMERFIRDNNKKKDIWDIFEKAYDLMGV